MLTPPFADRPFAGAEADDFIEHGCLALALTEDSPEALDMLSDTPAARDNNADIGLGDINALVQDFAGDEYRQLTLPEGRQDGMALGGVCVMCQDGQEEFVADGVGRAIVGGEDERPV